MISSGRRSDPAWIYVQEPRDGELQYATFRYLPEYHFCMAYDRLIGQEVEPDGGYDTLHDETCKATVYYWLNPETGAALYHTGVNDEATISFFPDEETARDYLEHRAAIGDPDQYNRLSLYKVRTRKIADTIDVLTDQAGFGDFVPDTGP